MLELSRGLSACGAAAARDQREGLALDLQRHIGSIPTAIDEKKVLLAFEAQQRGGLEAAAFSALGEKDRIVSDESPKLTRNRAHHVELCALTGRLPCNPHVPVGLTVENYQIDHDRLRSLQQLYNSPYYITVGASHARRAQKSTGVA
jgi:hypothetical protein